jgi:hypothetical protein
MSNDPRKFKTGIAVTGTATVGGDTVTTNNASQTLQNKSIDADTNTITNIDNADIKVGAAIDASKIANGSVSNTEFQYLDGVTSPIQTQLTNNATGLSDHLSDASDAHDASAISNVPAGNLAATDVQGALNELQSDVDDRALDADVIKKDGSVAFTAAQSMGGFKLTSLAAGTVSSDAVNKGQLDAALEGLKPKAAVRVATTANITIATALNSGDVIDGVTLANGDRVLVKDQTAAENNGIYVVSATPSRSTDFDSLSPIDEINGSLVAVQEGTANAGKVFVQSGTVAVLGTDPINFVFFNSSASLVGGDGITVSGSNISVDHDGEGLQFVSTQLALELDGSTLSKSASGLKVADQGITNTQVSNSAAIAYSKLNLSNSIVNADIASAAAIDASKIADGSVSNAEFQFINSLTSNAQNQLDGKASTTLNNLGTTSINANLLPSSNGTRSIGSASLMFAEVFNQVYRDSSGGARLNVATADTTLGSNTANIELSAQSGTNNRFIRVFAQQGIRIHDGGTNNYIGLRSSGLSGSTTFVLPIADGTSGQALTTNGSGQLAFSTISSGSPSDIQETSFALANNQASAANVTGLAFANASVRSFQAFVSVQVDATSDLFEVFELNGVQRGADWSMSVEANGDDSQVNFTITNAGQVQYTSGNYTGFTAGAIKFRAITTAV